MARNGVFIGTILLADAIRAETRAAAENLRALGIDEFVMLTRLPDAAGKYYFRILQGCAQGETRWEEIPAEGKTMRDYKTPAAQLEVMPVQEHKHH